MDTTQFNVVAKVPAGTTAGQLGKMLQELLVERFQMQVHHESRAEPDYELTVAKNGPKLTPAAEGSGTDDFGSAPRRATATTFPSCRPVTRIPPARTGRTALIAPSAW